MPLTVRELATLPVLSGAQIIAGHGGLDRQVLGINVMEVPDVESFVRPGEILLTTAYPLRDRLDSLTDLIDTLDDTGLAALAVKPGRYLDRIPDEALRAADRRGFPIFLLADHTSFNDVIGAVLAIVLAEYGAEPARAEAIRERLTGVALAGGGLGEIARTLSGALDRPVTIVAEGGAVLGTSDATETGHTLETSWPFPITVGGSQRGEVIVGGTREPTLGQRRLIRQASFAAAMHIAQAIASIELDRRMRVLFLEELVTGTSPDEALQRERSRLFGWDFAAPHQVMLARFAVELPDSAIVDLLENASVLPPGTHAWTRGREAVAIVPTATVASNHDLAQAWRTALTSIGGRDVIVTSGSIVAHPMHLAVSYGQARESVMIAQAMGLCTARFDELTLERLLLSAPSAQLDDMVQREIGPLIAADDESDLHLCDTLEAYLGLGNAAEAARGLFIHYNTMKHRMSRIGDLLGADLHDPRTRLTLAIALRIRKLKGGS